MKKSRFMTTFFVGFAAALGLLAGCQSNTKTAAPQSAPAKTANDKAAPTDAMAGGDAERAKESMRKNNQQSDPGYIPNPPDDRAGMRAVDQPQIQRQRP